MALIKSISEIKAVLPKLVSNLNNPDQLPNFDAAEIKYLVPIIGVAQYNDLQEKYDAADLNAAQSNLLKHVQLLIAVNAFRDEMIINQVMWTDQGLRTMTTAELGKPVGWEFKKLEAFFIDRSADAEEILLTYLWSYKISFPLWTASDEYKAFTSLLIRTGTDFKLQYRSISQPMRTYYQLQPVVSEVQEKYLEEGIGRALVKYFVDLAAPADAEKEFIRLAKKSLAYFTIKEACLQLPVRISDAGLTVSSQYGDKDSANDAGREGASAAAIDGLQNHCDLEGQNYLSKLRYELWKHRKANPLAGFSTAYDAGALSGYIPPSERTRGNDERKFFVM